MCQVFLQITLITEINTCNQDTKDKQFPGFYIKAVSCNKIAKTPSCHISINIIVVSSSIFYPLAAACSMFYRIAQLRHDPVPQKDLPTMISSWGTAVISSKYHTTVCFRMRHYGMCLISFFQVTDFISRKTDRKGCYRIIQMIFLGCANNRGCDERLGKYPG